MRILIFEDNVRNLIFAYHTTSSQAMSETVSLDLLQFSTVSPHAWFLHGCEITTNKRLCGTVQHREPASVGPLQ